MAYVYIVVQEDYEYDDDFGYHIIGGAFSSKETAVKALRLAMSQLINENEIYTVSNWYRNNENDWTKKVQYFDGYEDMETCLSIVRKEVI